MRDKEKLEVWLNRSLTKQEESLAKLSSEPLKNLKKTIEKQSGQNDTAEEFKTKLSALRYMVSEELGRRGYTEEQKIKFISWNELRNQEFEEPRWIIENLIPEKGLVAITGSPESGKSWFTEYLAIKVASGESIFNQFPATKTPVLIIDQENLQAWLNRRIRQLSSQQELPIYFFPKEEANFSLEDEEVFSEVLDFVEENEIKLIIIDTLRLAHGKEENSSTEMKPVFDKLKELTTKAAVVFIHHHRKGNKFGLSKVPGEDMMGSIFIRGAVDYQLTLTKKEGVADSVTRVNITQTKSRYTRPIKPFEITLEQTDTGLEFVYQGEVQPEKLKLDEAKEAILALLEGESFNRKEVIDQVVESEICGTRTVEEALKVLVYEKKITHTKTKPHIYSLIDSSEEDPANRNSIYKLRDAESLEKRQPPLGVTEDYDKITEEAVKVFAEPLN